MTCLAVLALQSACSDVVDKRIVLVRVQPQADPECGAPADAHTMIVRGLGDFAPSESSAQSIALGDEASFEIDRFPATTRVLEVEVLGLGGIRRTMGRSDVFDLDTLKADSSIAVFMAPPLDVCPTGPQVQARRKALLAMAGENVLLVGGLDESGTPLSTAELYRPTSGIFSSLRDTLYGASSPSGLQGASLTVLGNGKVALVGGGATAFQIFDPKVGAFGSPAFYREARSQHASVALGDDRIFVAGGCSQPFGEGCAAGAELRTTSFLDTGTGELEAGPALQLPRIGGVAYAETEVSVLLVGGRGVDGQAIASVERVFFDGRSSQLIDGLSGVSVQAESGAIWMGMAAAGDEDSGDLAVLAPGGASASLSLAAAVADNGVSLTSLQDGSLLVVGTRGAQRIRTLDGEAELLSVGAVENVDEVQTIRLRDGSVLILGYRAGMYEAFIFRPSLVGPDTASVIATFSSPELSEGLSASDAAKIRLVEDEGYHLQVGPGPEGESYLIVAGPVLRDSRLEAGLSAQAGEVTLLFGWQSYAEHWKVALRGGREVRLFHVQDAADREVDGCRGKLLPVDALAGERLAHDVQLHTQAGRLSVSLDGLEILACNLQESPAGRAGLGFAGASDETLRVDIISVERSGR